MRDIALYGTFHIWKRMCETGGAKVSGGIRRIIVRFLSACEPAESYIGVRRGFFFFFLWFRDDWRGQRNCFQHTGWTHTKLEFQDIFSSGLHGLGQTGVTKHKTNTDDASPICQNPRRLPIALREEAFKAVEEMHALGIIEPSRGLGRTWKSENVFRRAPTKAPNFPPYFYGIAFFCKKED